MEEPPIDEVLHQFGRLEEDARTVAEEIKVIVSQNDSLKKELDSLQDEEQQLEVIIGKKQDLKMMLQFQDEEAQGEVSRQLELNAKYEDLLKQYRCEIQEIKLQQRKQRINFEKELQQLIEMHKNLSTVFAPERLPSEIKSAEIGLAQLSAAVQLKLAQLDDPAKELEEAHNRKQAAAPNQT